MKIQLALAAVPLSIARKYVKDWNKNGIGVQAVRKFMKKTGKKGYRLYVPIRPRKSIKVVPPVAVTQALSSQGYKIEDYITGIAVDSTGKRRIRIGKLLKDEQLRQEFANDPQRSAHKDEYTCVISAHPYDVIGMSTGRRWDMTSCMRLDYPGKHKGGIYQAKVSDDVAEGTIVAYAVSPKDTNINNPHARLLIKPFYKDVNGRTDKSVILFRVETKAYGTPIPGFMETVSAWLRKVNKGAEAGIYKLSRNLYDDGIGELAVVGYDPAKMSKDEQFQYLDKNYDDMAHIIANDPRWLGALLPNIEKIYQSNADNAAASLMMVMDKVILLGTPLNAIGKQIEQHMLDAHLPALARFMPGDSKAGIVRYSSRLKKAVDDLYAYDPQSPNLSSDEILRYRAFWDSRWLSKLADVPDQHGACNIFLYFIRERLKPTPEFRHSKAPGALALFKFLGLMFRIAAKSENIDFAGVKLSQKLAKRFPVDTYFDEQTKRMMGRMWEPRMMRATGKHPGEPAQGLLCAVDKSWPAENLELISDAGNIIFRKDVFEELLKINHPDAYEALAARMSAAVRVGLPSDWKRDYPWTIPFIKKIANGPYNQRQMAWAKRFLESLNAIEDDMDAILDQLGDLGDDFFKPAEGGTGF